MTATRPARAGAARRAAPAAGTNQPSQLTLPIDGDCRRSLIASALSGGPLTVDGLTLSVAQVGHLRRLLVEIENCGLRFGAQPRMEVLAARISLSVRQTRRYVRLARRLGVLATSASHDRRSGGQGPNGYQLDFDALRRLASRDHPPQCPVILSGRPDKMTGRPDKMTGRCAAQVVTGHDLAGQMSGPVSIPVLIQTKPPPSADARAPSAERTGAGGDAAQKAESGKPKAESWGGVVAALRACGVVEAERAAQKCQAAGASAELALAAIDHWRRRPGAWGAGALGWRVGRLAAGQDPASGWPSPDPAAQSVQRRAAVAASQQRMADQHAAALAQREEDARRAAETEARYGAALDALDDAQRDALARALGWQGLLWRQYLASGRGRQAGIVRVQLLEASGEWSVASKNRS